jgi:hypothetical protein
VSYLFYIIPSIAIPARIQFSLYKEVDPMEDKTPVGLAGLERHTNQK